MTQTIYHYCSLQAFEGIITNKCLRLSNAFKSNDHFELNWIFQLMRGMGKFDLEYILKLEYIYHLGLRSFFKPHMVCFSKEADLLSQWRGYANDGKGVCIGFNREYFEKSMQYNENKEFEIYDVLYSESQQKREILKFIKSFRIENDIDNLIKEYRIDKGNLWEIFKVAGDLFNLGIRFKNPSFKEEKEIRVVHGYPSMAAEPDMFKFKFTEENMISYVEIPINHKELFPVIDEIIVGPKSKIELKDLNYFVQGFIQQWDIKFYRSSCSLK